MAFAAAASASAHGDVCREDERIDFAAGRDQAVVDETVAPGAPERRAAEVDGGAAFGADGLARIMAVEDRFPLQIGQARNPRP